VVTAPVGVEPLLEAKPTWVKVPFVGTIYRDLVALKATVLLFGEIVQAVVVLSGSRLNVMFVATVAQDAEAVVPIYASPVLNVRKKFNYEVRMALTVCIENCSTVGSITSEIGTVCIQKDARLC
jgi:hypothetical protein